MGGYALAERDRIECECDDGGIVCLKQISRNENESPIFFEIEDAERVIQMIHWAIADYHKREKAQS
jgi:hypothetical protein